MPFPPFEIEPGKVLTGAVVIVAATAYIAKLTANLTWRFLEPRIRGMLKKVDDLPDRDHLSANERTWPTGVDADRRDYWRHIALHHQKFRSPRGNGSDETAEVKP